MAEGCHERFDFGFLQWVWNFPTRSRPKVLALLDSHRETKTVVSLRRQREIDEFVTTQRVAATRRNFQVNSGSRSDVS